jgi:hypothetical protein
VTEQGCASPGWPQYRWGIYIRPINQLSAIRAIRDHKQVSIAEAIAILDAFPKREDGYIGPVDEIKDHPDYDVYHTYAKYIANVLIIETDV